MGAHPKRQQVVQILRQLAPLFQFIHELRERSLIQPLQFGDDLFCAHIFSIVSNDLNLKLGLPPRFWVSAAWSHDQAGQCSQCDVYRRD